MTDDTRVLDITLGKLHSPSKVCAYFGVNVDTLRRWCADGTIPATNIGTDDHPRYKISEKTINAWRRKHDTDAI